MATVSFPTFNKKEILLAEKLNSFVQSLENKFTAGFGAADIQWPLVAQGNLNMGTGSSGYSILGGKQIFNVVNANSYSSFAAAVTAAGSGGCVFVPPNTTISTDGATLVGSNVSVIGAGPSSVLKFTAAPTGGYMIRTDTGAVDSFLIANLTLDGNSDAGASQHGVVLRRASQVSIIQVWFKDFSGDCVRVENDGTGGNKSTRVRIQGCFFEGGTGKHIFFNDVQDLLISGNVFRTCDEQAIYGAADGASATLERVAIIDNQIYDADNSSIYVIGSGAASSLRRDVLVQGNLLTNQDADAGIVVGTAGNVITNAIVRDNILQNQAAGDGINVCVEKGQVRSNQIFAAAADAIDLTSSKYVLVSENHCGSATNYGIDASDSSTCIVHDNYVADCNTAMGLGASLRQYHNVGQTGVPPSTIYVATDSQTITIPGYQLQVGDAVRMWAGGSNDGTSAALRITIDGNNLDTTEASTSSGNRLAHVFGFVKDTTTLQLWSTGHIDDRDVDIDFTDITGLDFTADVTITQTLTAGAASYAGLVVELRGAESV